ncbi:MAG: hypothetical protein JO027_04200 [Solirubrobacterales bacterium]|nr:hypothetical protein [Solirubrobacterales bacterium]
MSLVDLFATVPLLAWLAACLWVYRDAEANVAAGTPVYLQIGALRIDTPEAWAVACSVLLFVFMPLYLAARKS